MLMAISKAMIVLAIVANLQVQMAQIRLINGADNWDGTAAMNKENI